MSAAIMNGFPHYFGAITKGLHDFDEDDRSLVGKESFEDLTEQHIDITSEPHIRAAMAEKWAKSFCNPAECVWVSAEVGSSDDIDPYSYPALPDSRFTLRSETVDLRDVPHCNRKWPFEQSKFQAIGPRERRNEA